MEAIITNFELFNSTVNYVDISNVKNVTKDSFYANVEIELENGDVREMFGEFSYNDYKDEFGFIFKKY